MINIDNLLEKILEFTKLENVDRALARQKGDRKESSAEHSWHMAMMAMLIAPHYEHKLDMEKVFKLIVVHDLVEIIAGDTYYYDDEGRMGKKEREDGAAKKLFKDFTTSQEFIKLWNEFELQKTKESNFVKAIDLLSPAMVILRSKAKPPWYKKITIDRIWQKYDAMDHSNILKAIFSKVVSDLDKRKYFK